ncbi:MAG: hypothetical protein HY805_02165 [Nitrospirae bacterium]|nr:hypothetical protein [Nitrospirota bacterium]
MEDRKLLKISAVSTVSFTIQFVFIFLISYAVCAEGFVLSGFQGYVLDKESGKPIENAYVICFTDYYSFGQRFNLGGPNSRPDSMQIAKTDKNGFFIMKLYKKYSGGWADERSVFFLKEGYIYALEYLQLSKKKDVLRDNPFIYRPGEEIPLKGTIKIYLSNKERKDINGEVMINGYLGLLYRTRYYHDYFKDNNKAEFKRLKPYFLELYKIFNEHSDTIMKTFSEPHLVENWRNELNRYRESLNGQIREITYFIYFVKDENGLWKIESF